MRITVDIARRRVVEQLEPMSANPVHRFRPDTLGITDASVFHHARLSGPRQMTDGDLPALAVANGGRLLTLDGGISPTRVVGATKEHVVALR